ncbi:MAG: hypothetical protein LBU89_07895 [Fibromonadaceae bacterium]|jgi:hypothetical protein|nr:hypothetical protein [Fibromonadaceae bacterium]
MSKHISIKSFIFFVAYCSLFITHSYAGVPLPGQGIAQAKGVAAGMGIGTLNSMDCRTLWTWTGHGSYSYNSFVSGGASIKFLGGNIDSEYSLVNQRYSLNAKFMDIQPKYAFFIGPIFSFENTDLSFLRQELASIGEQKEETIETDCSKLYANIGSSIGYQSGVGYLATPDWGFTLGHNLDLTFRGNIMIFFSGSIAFNLRNQFEKLMENTKNFWLSFEYSTRLSEDSSNAHNLILGMVVGF